jgi:cellulose biosynthesis protein BcsQ
MVDRRKKLHREIIQQDFPERITAAATVIPALSIIERMSAEREPVTVFAPRSTAARAYQALWADVRVVS